jgi:hypothetical protein
MGLAEEMLLPVKLLQPAVLLSCIAQIDACSNNSVICLWVLQNNGQSSD